MRRLLIRPGAIGDVILSLAALEYLKADYTEVWVPSALVPLIQFADSVRAISGTGIETLGVGDLQPSGALRERLAAFDEIVTWYGTGRDEFRRALIALNPCCQFHAALPPADCANHATDFFATQVGAPLGLTSRIAVTRSADRGTVAIHPFSGSPKKNWPLKNFREYVEQFDMPVEWVAGPEEELEGAHRFESLLDLVQWLTGARLYIGNDSGISHLAAAVGVRSTVFFGPTDPRVWAPRGATVVQF